MALRISELFNFIQGSDITGESSWDIYHSIYPESTEQDFLSFIKGKTAYEYWKNIEGNQKKTEEEFVSLFNNLESLSNEKDERESGDAQTLIDSKAYTDEKLAEEITNRESGDEQVLESAKEYCDNIVLEQSLSKIVVHKNPTTISVKSSMQIIFYANKAGQMTITMGDAKFSKYLSSVSDVCWALWMQTGDIDGSLIFSSGSRQYLTTNKIVSEMSIEFAPDDTSGNSAYIFITIT